MTASTHFEFDELAGPESSPQAYREVLRRRGFSMGVYTLPVGAEDHQHPHDADEVYIVMHGVGTLWVDGTDHPVTAGSVVSVDRGIDHCFTEITETLSVLVLFAPPESPAED